MMKRAILLSVCAALMLAPARCVRGAEVPAQSPATATNRVNILFLIDDQHRGDWLGAAGAKWMITPNLDRLAREGVLFTAARDVQILPTGRMTALTGAMPVTVTVAHGEATQNVVISAAGRVVLP